MKKIIISLLFLLSLVCYGETKIEKLYQEYPFSNPFDATIIGSSMLMIDGVSENIPLEDYEIKSSEKEKIPENLWHQKNFRFSLVKQKGRAPLIFLLAGTGSDYNSNRMKLFQRILYDAGFHVISISSQMTVNFITSASRNHVPGILKEDTKDMYEIMKKAYESVKDKVGVSEFLLLGYSLGATNTVFISQMDDKEKFFQFRKIFMVNPAVDLYSSARKLDFYLNQTTKGEFPGIEAFLEELLTKIKENTNEYSDVNVQTIYKSFQDEKLSDEQKGSLVGFAFRINAIDLNYVTDLLSKTGVYTKLDEKVGKFSPMLKYFVRIKFGDFETYVNKIALPYYKKKLGNNFSKERLIQESSLHGVEEYLKNTPKIVAVTNADELILNQEDLQFLRNTMGNRLLVYPHGGHCGNMFYDPNVQIMLNYLKEGVFWNEK